MPRKPREVFPSETIAHLWAHAKQPHARSSSRSDGTGNWRWGSYETGPRSSNYWFNGPSLYSYNTCIARITPITPCGEADTTNPVNVVLARYEIAIQTRNNARYSVTTSKHIAMMQSACRNVIDVFFVTFITDMTRQRHLRNLGDLCTRYREEYARLARAINAKPLIHLSQLESDAREYALLFGLNKPELPVIEDCARLTARWKRLETARNDPAAIAKREKAKAIREASQERKLAEHIEAWKAGRAVPQAVREQFRKEPIARLRIVSSIDRSRQHLETSKGICVNLNTAARLFPLLRRLRTQKGDISGRRIINATIEGWRIQAMNEDHSITAGCHRIPWPEIEDIATRLAILDKSDNDIEAQFELAL